MHSALNTCIYDSSVVCSMSVHFHTYMVLDVPVQHIYTQTYYEPILIHVPRLYSCIPIYVYFIFSPASATYIYTCLAIHTYIHTDIYTCRHTFLPTYLHPTYLLTSLHQYIIPSMHTSKQTYIHTYLHPYKHTFLLPYLTHLYMHAYIHNHSDSEFISSCRVSITLHPQAFLYLAASSSALTSIHPSSHAFRLLPSQLSMFILSRVSDLSSNYI